MVRSALDVVVSTVGFPPGTRKATSSAARWLLALCVASLLLALIAGAAGVFVTFARLTHDRRTAAFAGVIAFLVLRAMSRLVVSGSLIPLHFAAPPEDESCEPDWLWLELFGQRPATTATYRPPWIPTIVLALVVALAAQPLSPLLLDSLVETAPSLGAQYLMSAALTAAIVCCVAVRHALHKYLYPYLLVVWADEVAVLRSDLAFTVFAVALAQDRHRALLDSNERQSLTTPIDALSSALERRRTQKVNRSASSDGSQWADLFEPGVELRYRFSAPSTMRRQRTVRCARIIGGDVPRVVVS